MQSKYYHTVGTVPKYIRTIGERDVFFFTYNTSMFFRVSSVLGNPYVYNIRLVTGIQPQTPVIKR
jgi:hypothetical protein